MIKRILNYLFNIRYVEHYKIISILGIKIKIKFDILQLSIMRKASKLAKYVYNNINYESGEIIKELVENKFDPIIFDDQISADFFMRGYYKLLTGKNQMEIIDDFKRAVFSSSTCNIKFVNNWVAQSMIYAPEKLKKDFKILLDKYSFSEIGSFALANYACLIDDEKTNLDFIYNLKNELNDFEIWHYPKLSYIYSKHNNSNELINKAATVYKIISKYNEKTFIDFIKNKSVCVVGNSPCEKGLNNGINIDAHDIVIRFNNYSCNNDFVKDYGEKTNVWVRVYNPLEIVRKIDKNIQFVIFNRYFYNMPNENLLDEIIDWDKQGVKIIFLPKINRDELREQFELPGPTAGIQMIYWLYKINKKIYLKDFYGFSFTDQLKDWNNRHYFKLNNETNKYVGLIHNWKLERNIYERLINE